MSKNHALEKKSKHTKTALDEDPKIKKPTAPLKNEQKIRPKVASTTSKSEHNLRTGKLVRIPSNPKSSSTPSIPSTSKMTRKKPPTTPPSGRVTKSQYFPQKRQVSAPLAEPVVNPSTPKPQTLKEIRKRESVKDARKVKSRTSEEKVEPERPRTATLKKGLIVNEKFIQNIVNEESLPKKLQDDYMDEYEDDFDSYESDFEAYASSGSSAQVSEIDTSSCSSSSCSITPTKQVNDGEDEQKQMNNIVDEERKLDSGTFDLSDTKHKPILHNIKESTEHHPSNLPSLSDEGFEEVKSSQFESTEFINFSSAQKKNRIRNAMATKKKRGEELLGMIKLDRYNFTLFELAPIPYDVFMRTYGNRNGLQASSQTGDDNVYEETQTDEIMLKTKWTQMPVSFSKIDNCNVQYRQELLGVGCDVFPASEKLEVKFDVHRLEKFVEHAGRLILALLREKTNNVSNEIQASSMKAFSDGLIEFNTANNVLCETSVVQIMCGKNDFSQILTLHKRTNDESPRSFVCLWYVSEPNEPENIFASYGDVSCSCFGFQGSSLVFGGLSNGSVSVWDTTEVSTVYEYAQNFGEKCLKFPKFVTDIQMGHFCKVVTIETLSKALNTTYGHNLNNNEASEVCTLDEEGYLIFWTVLTKSSPTYTENTILLVQNKKVSLQPHYSEIPNLHCTELTVYGNHLFISTSSTNILHSNSNGAKLNPKKFTSESAASCLESCPFSEQYFLAGFQDGSIGLYSRFTEKPLMLLTNVEAQHYNVKRIQWSNHKPCIFYAINNRNVVDIWDLAVSDMFPVYSVPFKEHVTCLRLIAGGKDDGLHTKLYMMMGTENGEIKLHILNKSQQRKSHDEFKEDINKFINYVNRL